MMHLNLYLIYYKESKSYNKTSNYSSISKKRTSISTMIEKIISSEEEITEEWGSGPAYRYSWKVGKKKR